ncbi:uncharacterized protein F5Z01DRAFT_669655 [Emericellopsis atlantica]|uniref:Uncharacterized protein n=1 Tax=Emericellopsis atlantica TaxID=2614577 RepID=A0A9P7ZWP7_9HYPO|nr:uncharacterized protein F5Z01DRAFT_669655 [Emericellopsis atlantica]KAG9258920.1 hypothetical protein F5Z01DRAFT_669655 [Emericellopsis atlantica]
MNGRAGLRAWQWLFIFDFVIGVPVGIYRFWAIPVIHHSSKALGFSRHGLSKCSVPFLIAHVLGIRVYSYFNLWLRDTGRWSTEEVKIIPSAGYGLQIIFALTYAWTSEAIQMRWLLIIVACVIAMIGTVILSVWPDGNLPAMMTGWLLTFLETGAGALIITWIHVVLSYSAEHRAIRIGIVDTAAFTFQAWMPLFVYNTGEAPHFPIGYEMATMFFGLEIVLTIVIAWLVRKYPMKA